MADLTLIEAVDKRAKDLKTERETWENQWQLAGEFIHLRKQEFNSQHQAGDFLTEELFDSTGPKAAKTAASSILTMLWPNTRNRLKLRKPRGIKDSTPHKTFYENATETMMDVLDNPEGGLPLSLDEYMLDSITFGTGGIEILESEETDVMYRFWGVKHMSIAQGRNGKVDTVYLEVEIRIEELVAEYGVDKVSEKSRKKFDNGNLNDKVMIRVAVEPRRNRVIGLKGNKNMPFQSVHMEITPKHILRESGFDEQSIKVARFWKIAKEVYGRSPGMEALSDVLELNAIWESVTVAIEKQLDPPLGLLDDGKLGGGELDTSAGALNVFNISGRAGEQPPIFPLFTVGEIQSAIALTEHREETISSHFFVDRLLDFNNETQMTATETTIRDRLRNRTMSTVFVRQINELFSPLVNRTFNILLKRGKFGLMPGSNEHILADFNDEPFELIPEEIAEAILNGDNVFDIEYFTPASRLQQTEELEGILVTWEQAAAIAAVRPSVLDMLDEDVSIQKIAQISGAPSQILKAQADVDAARKAQAEAIAKQQEQEQALAAAEAARNVGQSGLVPTQRPQEVAA